MRLLILHLLITLTIGSVDQLNAEEVDAQSEAEFLLRGCQASRLRLRTGDCVFIGSKSLRLDKVDVEIKALPVRYRIAFDNDNESSRYEFEEPFISTVQNGMPGDEVTSTPRVVHRKVIFSLTSEAATVFQTGDGLSDSICSVFSPDGRTCPPGCNCFDPRSISLCEIRKLWNGQRLNDAIDAAMSNIRKVSSVEPLRAGVSRITLTYDSSRTEIDIDETKDFAPIRFAVLWSGARISASTGDDSADQSGEDFEVSNVSSEWEKVFGEWLPTKVETSFRTLSLNHEESFKLDVEWNSVNGKLEPSLFSYKTFGLKHGTTIVDDRLPKNEYGGSIVIETVDSNKDSIRSKTPKLIFWLNLFGATLALLFFIVRRCRKRPA